MLRGMKFVCLAWLSAIMTHNAFCSSGFTIIPESVVVAIGEKATFYCQALQARYVDWKINGQYLGQDPPVDITPGTERDRNDSLVSTLTIQGRPDLNQTQVECEATSWDGSMETSSPVTLTISDDTVKRVVRRRESVRLECYRANSTIGWTVNGIIVGGYSFRGLTLETASESFNESRLHTLTLIVNEDYDDVIINITCFTSLNQRRRLIKLYKVVVQGTYSIQNISVTSPQPGEVRVTGDFIDGSTATGLLTIISEIFYHLIERRSDQLHIEGSIQGVVGGEHSISFFVVEESGLPSSTAASTSRVVSVENSNDVNQPSIEYSLQSNSTGVCITCTFLEDSMTDCFVVVHKYTNSHSLMRIEANLTRNFLRSGDTASGCIEGVNMEDYQVGVVGGRQVMSKTTTSMIITDLPPSGYQVQIVVIAVILSAVIIIGAVSCMVLAVVLIVVWYKSRPRCSFAVTPNASETCMAVLCHQRVFTRTDQSSTTQRHSYASSVGQIVTPSQQAANKRLLVAGSDTKATPNLRRVDHDQESVSNENGSAICETEELSTGIEETPEELAPNDTVVPTLPSSSRRRPLAPRQLHRSDGQQMTESGREEQWQYRSTNTNVGTEHSELIT